MLDLARRAGAALAAALARRVATQAREVALATLAGSITVDVAIFDRQGALDRACGAVMSTGALANLQPNASASRDR